MANTVEWKFDRWQGGKKLIRPNSYLKLAGWGVSNMSRRCVLLENYGNVDVTGMCAGERCHVIYG